MSCQRRSNAMKGRALASLSLLSLIVLCKSDALPDCKPLDYCSCQLVVEKSIISLQEIDYKSGGPRFKNIDELEGRYKYFYNPCTPMNYNDLENVLIYQTKPPETTIDFNLGSPTLSVDIFHPDYHFKYSGKNKDNEERFTDITLKCDSNADVPSVGQFSEDSQYHYSVTLTTKCACPGGCSYDPHYFDKISSNPEQRKLSIGSILCITLAVLVVVYLVLGILLNKFAMNKTGISTIPNWSFWRDFPTLVKDGASFVVTYLKEGPCNRTQYKEIR